MARTAVKRSTLPDLDRFLIGRQRHFVSYLDGARLYDLSYHTFVTLAKEANANLRVKKTVIVDTGIIEDYLAANPDKAEYYNALREV